MNRLIQHFTFWAAVAIAPLILIARAGNSGTVDLSLTPQGQPTVRFEPIPSAEVYHIEHTPNLAIPFSVRADGTLGLFEWTSFQPETGDAT